MKGRYGVLLSRSARRCRGRSPHSFRPSWRTVAGTRYGTMSRVSAAGRCRACRWWYRVERPAGCRTAVPPIPAGRSRKAYRPKGRRGRRRVRPARSSSTSSIPLRDYLLRLDFGLGCPLAIVFVCGIGPVGITRTGFTLVAIADGFGAAAYLVAVVSVLVFLGFAISYPVRVITSLESHVRLTDDHR